MKIDKNTELEVASFPGYAFSRPSKNEEPISQEDSEVEFKVSLETLERFIQARSPDVILAKTAFQRRVEYIGTKGLGESRIEQGQLEVLQALCLMQKTQKNKVPTAPSNFVKLWPLLASNVTNFLRKQKVPNNATGSTISRIRTQTLYYRNIFDSDGCKSFVGSILKTISPNAAKELGFSLFDVWIDLTKLCDLVGKRQHKFMSHIISLRQKKNLTKMKEAIEFFRNANPITKRAYQFIDMDNSNLEYLHYTGYQLSELANTWIYTFSKNELLRHFSEKSIGAFFNLTIKYGTIDVGNPEYIYLDNPVWSKPFIENREGNLFVPMVELIYSFPFKIIQTLIGDNEVILDAYLKARSVELEDSVKNLVESALPSALVYQNVEWTDPDTNKKYENDIVAVIGNHIIIFEAKSGQLRGSTRRGGSKSIVDDFDTIFIEPGRQAHRLQEYLNKYGKRAVLREKKSKQPIRINMDKPKVVVRYAVCIEHFASITSTNDIIKSLDFETDDNIWAPILSIGELQIIHRMLDTEVSFLHYLCRRFTLQKELLFLGDEQDILSAYITNGFNFDKQGLEGTLVVFQDADMPVRVRKTPRKNRQTSKLAGHTIKLTLATDNR